MEKFVVIDTETTGNAPKKGDKIIQIGAVVVEGDRIVDTFSTFVQPFHDIPVFIQQLTGITEEDVKDAPPFKQIAPQLLEMLEGAYFVAHNVPFDLSFINEELKRAGFPSFAGPVIDTVECTRILFPSAPGYQLNQLAAWLDISHDRPHQADSDALVTADLWLMLSKKLADLPATTLQSLLSLSKGFESDVYTILQSLYQGKKSDELINEETGIEVFNGLAVRAETGQPDAENRELWPEEGIFFEEKGLLAANWEKFEVRDGQQEMANAVKEALVNHEHVLLEAGTGSGKTLSYLVPALRFALETNNQVIVSTHTIALQEQLMHQEIPLLKKVLPFSFRSVLMKGRSNYLCLRKLKQVLSMAPATYEETLALSQCLVWMLETETGDVEEINLAGGTGSSFWEKVKSDETVYAESSRNWLHHEYYHRAREKAGQADVIITNHALLFTDIRSDQHILPSSKYVIIDEAHHLDELASNHLGSKLDYFQVNQVLNRLGIVDKTGYFSLLTMYEQTNIQHFSPAWYQRRLDHFALLKYETDELFRMLSQYCREKNENSRTDVGRLMVSYQPGAAGSSYWVTIEETVRRVQLLLDEEEQAWLSFYDYLQEVEPTKQAKQLLQDFHAAVLEARAACHTLFTLLTEKDDNTVYWMETDVKGAANAAYLYARPADVSELLADQFFAKKRSVVLTSAALTVRGSFEYVMNKWGLVDFGPRTLRCPSPYDYANKVKLLVPEDITAIKDDEKAFIKETAEFIYHGASITEGKMLVLFTSFHMLKKAYYQLKKWDEASNFTIIAQGVNSGSRSRLMKSFKQHDNAILLGTSAFWEGIDIPGEDLSCLIIVRLPFSPPRDPVENARMEQVRTQGGSPFYEVSLPQAVLRFKQGFGRLIRHDNDKGVVVVLDKRLIQSSYGSHFTESLPALPVIHEPVDVILDEIADFLT
ncbi:ATP-dependent DNA helicase DinG [Bacillus piscicola]|uniref:ATP-dependent DNA helicase DinG n=1 Tax=Bacillus piscicola TaxID=1632684 RepID=UPI001F09F00E